MRKVAKTGAFCVFLSYKSLVDKCQTRYDTANKSSQIPISGLLFLGELFEVVRAIPSLV